VNERASHLRTLPRHGPFYLGLAAGVVAAALCLLLAPPYLIAVATNVMFAVYLALVAVEVPRLDPAFLRRRAADADSPVAAIFAVAILIVIVSVTFLFLTLNHGGPLNLLEIALSVTSVLLGWFTINTMASLHYAHEYYETHDAIGTRPAGGLAFPECPEPAGTDFLYFGFVVGMTAQVSDVEVTSRPMRRLVLMHSIFAFLFNTVLVAATVNVVVTAAGT
jgi:uncharacterized membrane protein